MPALPSASEVPTRDSSAKEFQDFAHRYDPTGSFRKLWGPDYTDHADALDEVLSGQLQAGRILPEAPVEDLLLCFCRMWTMAPYLGIDSLDAFRRNPRAMWLLDGIRRAASRPT